MAQRKELTPIQLRAIKYLVEKDVNKMTNEQIAKELGINPSTIYDWKKNPEFNDKLKEISKEYMSSYLADTFTQLRYMAFNKNISPNNKLKAIELILKNQGELQNIQDIKITEEVMDRSERDKYIAEMKKRISNTE